MNTDSGTSVSAHKSREGWRVVVMVVVMVVVVVTVGNYETSLQNIFSLAHRISISIPPLPHFSMIACELENFNCAFLLLLFWTG